VIGLFKSTIRTRILILGVLPFVIIYGIISVFIGQTVLRSKIEQTKIDVETLARFDEANLRSYIENVRLTVKIASVQLGNLDHSAPNARKLAERALLASFENWQIYNAWFVFEPNAFDGRDADHPFDYSGAPSGRFMRSYVRDRSIGRFHLAPNIDETNIDDPVKSSRYTTPRDTGEQYIAINSGDLFYDSGRGEGEAVPVSIVCPIFRGDNRIGCVGGDFFLDAVIMGPELISGARSVLFMDNGMVRYPNNAEFMMKTFEELGFPDPDAIRRAFARQETLFLDAEYSAFLDSKAYSCFMPVQLAEFGEIVYIYAAIPASTIMETVSAIFAPIGGVLIATFIIFTFLIFYLANSISGPIRELTAASEAISQGDFNRKFGVSHLWGEIGLMTRSLYRMIEQFRMYITLQERSKELLDIYTRLYGTLYQRDSIEDVFEATIFIIADYFKINSASLILLKNETALYIAQYTVGKTLRKMPNEGGAVTFDYHNQVAALLADRKYIFLNAAGMAEQGIAFAADGAASLCILPVRTGEILRGYFLMEGNEAASAFVHYDDALVFISDTLSYILTQKERAPVQINRPADKFSPAWPEKHEEADGYPADDYPVDDYPHEEAEPDEADPAPVLPVIQAARHIYGLDVDRGLSFIGGMEEQYGELLRISARVFTEIIPTLRGQYISDLPGFAIGIHGMKGALYNIGATDLGDAAKDLELAAKGGNAAFCQEAYPFFEDRLSVLARELTMVTHVEAGEGGEGSIPELKDALEKALEACRDFDAILARKTIAPFKGLSWKPEDLGTDVKAVAEAVENIDYDEAEIFIISLLKKIQDFEDGSQSGGGTGV
jgi:HAMP domain-containing protein/HPt (histidine-containing phosphotransfer) domain-containing protein